MKNALEGGSDEHMDDAESHTSTLESGDDDENEYIVEKVLAEKIDPRDGQLKFLVKWEGYDITKCTWEPEENFFDDDTLETWQKTKKSQTKEERFNWQVWDAEREREADLKNKRQSQKKDKLQQRETGSGDRVVTGVNKGAVPIIKPRQSDERSNHDMTKGRNTIVMIARQRQQTELKEPSDSPKDAPINKLPTRKKSITIRQQSSVASKPSITKAPSKDKLPSINKSIEPKGGGETAKPASQIRRSANPVNVPPATNEKTIVPQKQRTRDTSKNSSDEDISRRIKNKNAQENINQRVARDTRIVQGKASELGVTSPNTSPDNNLQPNPKLDEQVHLPEAGDLKSVQRNLNLDSVTSIPSSPDMALDSSSKSISFQFSLGWKIHGSAENQVAQVDAELHGLSDALCHHLSTLATPELCITRFLSGDYVKEFFVSKVGLPLEHLPTTISGEHSSKLIDCLSFLRGIAVVLSETFSILLIPPSFGKFHAVGLFGPTTTENAEALFSACVYPPLKLHRQSLEITNTDMGLCDQQLEKQLRLEAILSDGFDASRDKFVFVHPQDAFLETLELKTLISQYYNGRKWQKAEEISLPQTENTLTELSYDNLADRLQALRQARFHLIFLIHTSLRFTLHLLPHIATLRSLRSTRFFFYGTIIDHTEWLINRDPFEAFIGRDLIFLTSALLLENSVKIPGIISLIEAKTNLKLAVSSDIAEIVDGIKQRGFIMTEGTREFCLGGNVERIDLAPGKNRGLETECDALARFQDENYRNFRSLTVLCPDLSSRDAVKALYTSIDIMTVAEFHQKFTNVV